MTPDSSLPLDGLWLDECDSTNTELNRRAQLGAAHGYWVAAKKQTAGRGRAGSQWISSEGNLFLSVLVRDLPDPKFWTWVPLIAALAAREAVLEVRPELSDRLRVKWPNDLWLDHSKCCGILCEGHGSSQSSYIIVGIGLNALLAPRVDGGQSSAVEVAPKMLQPRIVRGLLQRLQSADRLELIAEWKRCTEFSIGTTVQWSDKKGGETLGFGRVHGLGEFGELQVILADGTLRALFSEEVSLRAAAGASGESLP